MKAGRPKTDKTAPARQSRARSNATADPVAAKPKDEAKPKKPRGVLGYLVSDVRLSDAARKRIREAWDDGVTPEVVAAFALYVIEIASQGHADGHLELKDFLVTLTKTGSHMAAAAQLGQGGGTGGASISVTFNGQGGKSSHPEIGERRPADPEIGDLIETE